MYLSSDFLIVIVGIAVVLTTAHYAVMASVGIARHFRMSDEFIGMTILAIGTSLPEIITHIIGSIKIISHPEQLNALSALVVGANVGSDIFQQNFLLGLVAVISVLTVEKEHLVKDVGGLLAAAVILLLFSVNGTISRLEGFILFFLYILYLFLLKKHGEDDNEEELPPEGGSNLISNTIVLIVCFVLMAFSASKVLDSSIVIVEKLDISSSLFGIIVLGIASALPELMTALVACLKKRAAISAGVLIGSNITNPMFALGAGAIISTYSIPSVVIFYDLPIKIVTAVLIFFILWKHKVMQKTSGLLLIVLYLIYVYLRNMYFPVDLY